MTSSLRVLTTASVDSSPSLVLIAPNGTRILVDCGEGTQRACLESNQRLSTVGSICLTSLHVGSTGGLPGLLLTAADVQQLATASARAEVKIKPQQSRGRPPDVDIAPSSHQRLWPFWGASSQNGGPNIQTLDIIGPMGTRAYIQALRHFIRRDNFPVSVREGSVDGELNSVPVGTEERSNSPEKKRAKQSHGDNGGKKKQKKKAPKEIDPHKVSFSLHSFVFHDFTEEEDHSKGRPHLHLKRPRAQRSNAETSSSQDLVSYLFTTPPLPGKFLVEKAKELGVPRGPLYGQLKAGKAVTFEKDDENGKPVIVTVQSEQVLTQQKPGVGVLVLRYPTKVSSLSSFLAQFDNTKVTTPDTILEVVVHMATEDLYDHPESVAWREKLPKFDTETNAAQSTEHIWMNLDPSADRFGTPHLSAARTARQRSLVSPRIYQSLKQPDSPGPALEHDANMRSCAYPSMEYQLIPRSRRGLVSPLPSSERSLQEEEALVQSTKETGAIEMAQKVTSESEDIGSDSLGQLIFTGTASAIPCKHRNVSGICYSSPAADGGRAMLLDVGEGTIGQLLRTPSWSSSGDSSLTRIKAVWISHPHADHHLGLLRLLHERDFCLKPEQDNRLLVIAPKPILQFLEEYEKIHPIIAHAYRGIDCHEFIQGNGECVDVLSKSMGVSGCKAVKVTHCPFSYGIVIDGTSFGRLVYSGDCRPSRALARAGLEADYLIHEATFEDGMEAEAAVKKHCTVGEALSIGHQMKAKNTILTHFSQRYPKIPPINKQESFDETNGTSREMNIVFAFDFMSLTPSDALLASKLTGALRLLFPAEEESKNVEDVGGLQMAKDAMEVPGLFAQSELL